MFKVVLSILSMRFIGGLSCSDKKPEPLSILSMRFVATKNGEYITDVLVLSILSMRFLTSHVSSSYPTSSASDSFNSLYEIPDHSLHPDPLAGVPSFNSLYEILRQISLGWISQHDHLSILSMRFKFRDYLQLEVYHYNFQFSL